MAVNHTRYSNFSLRPQVEEKDEEVVTKYGEGDYWDDRYGSISPL